MSINKLKELIKRRAGEIWDGACDGADFDSLSDIAAADLAARAEAEGGGARKIALRLFGQSGSGKSSQLLPMAEEYLKLSNIAAAHVAVGGFAKYFPGFDELVARVGIENMREKTNAFALTLMLCTIEKLSAKNVALIIELAMLEPIFEEYIIKSLSGYDVRLYGIACVRKISDANIRKRELETGRKVNAASVEYFWNEYARGLDVWRGSMPDAKCVLFSACSPDPVFAGAARDSVSAFKKYRALDCRPLSPEVLSAGKSDYIRRLAAA